MKTKHPARFVTAAAARERLGIDSHGLRRRVARGMLTAYVDPSDLRVKLFDVAELEALSTPRPIAAPRGEAVAVA